MPSAVFATVVREWTDQQIDEIVAECKEAVRSDKKLEVPANRSLCHQAVAVGSGYARKMLHRSAGVEEAMRLYLDVAILAAVPSLELSASELNRIQRQQAAFWRESKKANQDLLFLQDLAGFPYRIALSPQSERLADVIVHFQKGLNLHIESTQTGRALALRYLLEKRVDTWHIEDFEPTRLTQIDPAEWLTDYVDLARRIRDQDGSISSTPIDSSQLGHFWLDGNPESDALFIKQNAGFYIKTRPVKKSDWADDSATLAIEYLTSPSGRSGSRWGTYALEARNEQWFIKYFRHGPFYASAMPISWINEYLDLAKSLNQAASISIPCEKEHPVLQVIAYKWRGETVYLHHMDCCDFPNPVYDASCTYRCAPSGGIHGGGDFKCPSFSAEAKEIGQVWPSVDSNADGRGLNHDRLQSFWLDKLRGDDAAFLARNTDSHIFSMSLKKEATGYYTALFQLQQQTKDAHGNIVWVPDSAQSGEYTLIEKDSQWFFTEFHEVVADTNNTVGTPELENQLVFGDQTAVFDYLKQTQILMKNLTTCNPSEIIFTEPRDPPRTQQFHIMGYEGDLCRFKVEVIGTIGALCRASRAAIETLLAQEKHIVEQLKSAVEGEYPIRLTQDEGLKAKASEAMNRECEVTMGEQPPIDMDKYIFDTILYVENLGVCYPSTYSYPHPLVPGFIGRNVIKGLDGEFCLIEMFMPNDLVMKCRASRRTVGLMQNETKRMLKDLQESGHFRTSIKIDLDTGLTSSDLSNAMNKECQW
jgi:hypothetical protein|tara:strand:+ start:1820 stop:4096 length:2277 start_codon:yes stop_codon:yes gene_type:complete